jgi:hypothetical protein
MRELTDAQIEAMTPDERAEYARLRAAAKYTNAEQPGEPLIPGKYIWGGAGTLVLLALIGVMWASQKRAQEYLDSAPYQNQPTFRR